MTHEADGPGDRRGAVDRLMRAEMLECVQTMEMPHVNRARVIAMEKIESSDRSANVAMRHPVPRSLVDQATNYTTVPSLDEAVAWIQACQQESSSLARALRIGKYIIDNFFRDLDEVRSKAPRKSASLRRLQKRLGKGKHGLSAGTLGNYVRVATQERSLLTDEHQRVFDRLLLSQRLVLTQLDGVELKVTLAQRAIDEDLTCKQLKLLVAEANGAPAKPAPKATALRDLQREMRQLATRLSRAGHLVQRAAVEQPLRTELVSTSADLKSQLENLLQVLTSEEAQASKDGDASGNYDPPSPPQDYSMNCADVFTVPSSDAANAHSVSGRTKRNNCTDIFAVEATPRACTGALATSPDAESLTGCGNRRDAWPQLKEHRDASP